MGAWGTKVFESDEALDFLSDFVDSKQNIKILQSALDNVLNDSEEIDADFGEAALAAAEIIAVAFGKIYKDFSNEEFKSINIEKLKSQIDAALIIKALKAVERVQQSDKSELRSLWEDTEEYEEWNMNVNDLKSRLMS